MTDGCVMQATRRIAPWQDAREGVDLEDLPDEQGQAHGEVGGAAVEPARCVGEQGHHPPSVRPPCGVPRARGRAPIGHATAFTSASSRSVAVANRSAARLARQRCSTRSKAGVTAGQQKESQRPQAVNVAGGSRLCITGALGGMYDGGDHYHAGRRHVGSPSAACGS